MSAKPSGATPVIRPEYERKALELEPHVGLCRYWARRGTCNCPSSVHFTRRRIALALQQAADEQRERDSGLVAEYQRVMEAMVLNAHEPDKWPMELSQMVKMPKTLRELLERRAAAIQGEK